jgi:DNA-binding XRE family transcriptional regulator
MAQKKKTFRAPANNLRTIREKAGLKGTELAKLAGISTQSIHGIESRSRNLSVPLKNRLVNALNKDFTEVFPNGWRISIDCTVMANGKLKLYHYTSREFAQDITCSSVLRPGPSGVVYLSTHRVDQGTEAAAIFGGQGPIEFRCEVEVDPGSEGLQGPFTVQQIFSLDGFTYRRGGGQEYWYDGIINFDRAPEWIPLDQP